MASLIDNLSGDGRSSVKGQNLNQVLRRAAAETGVDFQYLLKTAERESSLNPALQAKTSSATGLFQFIEQTWFATLKNDGAQFGLEKFSSAIQKGSDGRFTVSDPKARAEILALRKDPEISAKLAASLTRKNANYLESLTGKAPNGGELYIAHFLGARGAGDLISATNANPTLKAADLFPEAAKANKTIFYNVEGQSRSVLDVYELLVEKHAGLSNPQVAPFRPEKILASHEAVLPSRYGENKSSSNNNDAFLSGHFDSRVSSFAPIKKRAADVFAAPITQPNPQSTFFSPQKERGESVLERLSLERPQTNVLQSRYGRFDTVSSPSVPGDALKKKTTNQKTIPLPTPAPEQLKDVTLYPSVSNEGKTVIITSSEYGKTDLPLDLSHYQNTLANNGK